MPHSSTSVVYLWLAVQLKRVRLGPSYWGSTLYQCGSPAIASMASDGLPPALHANIKSEDEV